MPVPSRPPRTVGSLGVIVPLHPCPSMLSHHVICVPMNWAVYGARPAPDARSSSSCLFDLGLSWNGSCINNTAG